MNNLRKSDNPQVINNDEIDLTRVFIKMLRIIQKYLTMIGILVGLGFILGVSYYFSQKPVYEATMIANSRILTNLRVESLIKVLDRLSSEGSAGLLANQMNISPEVASQVQSISVRSFKDDENTRRPLIGNDADTNVFEIKLLTFNNQHLDVLQNGIVHYLQNNEFVKKRTAIQMQNLRTMQGKLKEEERKLDSLRFSVNQLLAKGGNNSTVLMNDPGSMNKDMLALYEKELAIQTKLLLIDDVQVIQGFVPFGSPVKPQLPKNIAIGVGIAIVLCLVLIVVLETRLLMRKMAVEPEKRAGQEKELVV